MRTPNPSLLSKLLRGSRILVALLCLGGPGFHYSALAALAAALPLQTASKQVIASASEKSVRFVFLGELIQMRLEVIDSSGEVLFDSGFKLSNVIDWPLSDKQGQRLADGSYLCVVAAKDSSTQTTRRLGIASLRDQSVSLKQSDRSMLTAAQADAAGTVGDQVSLTIVEPGQASGSTVLAHDGNTAHLVSGSGGLSISNGDFFANKSLEHVRLTAEGNVGIGTSNPLARLDVDGLIRTSQGVIFPDGSIQLSAARKTFGAGSLRPGQLQQVQGQDAGQTAPDTSGTGTTGTIPKWQDGPAGVLTDSNITEVSGAIGINGAPNTSFRLDVNGSTRIRGSNPGFNLEGLSAGGNIWLFQTVDDNGRFRLFGQDNVNPGVERLTISLSTGNVGIGATNPLSRLDVAGNINTSTQYSIGGQRVLGAPGTSNFFAGTNAGASNTTGQSNSFFGALAGNANNSGSDNSFFGNTAGRNNTAGAVNSFFGFAAGSANTTACCNSFFGALAGQDNTGPNNAFFGYAAGGNNTTATGNSFFGAFAGQHNTDSSNNSFFGLSAGSLNTTGGSNSFFGSLAGAHNTDGGSNAFFGTLAGVANTIGSADSFFGTVAGQSNTTGSRNAFFGYSAGSNSSTATDNSFFGSQAGQNNTASFNSFFGASVGLVNTTGGANAFFGAGAGLNNTTGSSNSFFGRLAGNANVDGFNNSFFGSLAGQNNTGSQNTFVGYAAGLSNTQSFGNAFFGDSAGRFSNAIGNSFFGSEAGRNSTTGGGNSFFGYVAGINNSAACCNTFLGAHAGESNDSGYTNTFVGLSAGQGNTTGFENTFVGADAGENSTHSFHNAFFGYEAGNANITGSDNSLFGAGAGENNTTGSSNVFIGINAGGNNHTGNGNTFVGTVAGLFNNTGGNNTIVGSDANVGAADLDHATAIGAGASVSSSNTIVLGRSAGDDTVIVPGKLKIDTLGTAGSDHLCINSSNRVAGCSSSLRYKTNLAPYLSGLSIVNRLRPISFTWKEGGARDLGFGAEDVEKIDPLLVTYNKQGQVEGVKYDRINVVLVNAIKKQQKQIEELNVIKAENAELKAQLAAMLVRLERVEGKRAQRNQ